VKFKLNRNRHRQLGLPSLGCIGGGYRSKDTTRKQMRSNWQKEREKVVAVSGTRRSNECDNGSPRKKSETAKWVTRRTLSCNEEMVRELEVRLLYLSEVQYPLTVLEQQTRSCRSAKRRSRKVGIASFWFR